MFLFPHWRMNVYYPLNQMCCFRQSGSIGKIISYNNYFENECILCCTYAFLAAAVITTTINDCASPTGSTKLDDKTWHNFKLSPVLYEFFTLLVLGIDHVSWANTCTESTFCNLILQEIDDIVYYDTDNYVDGHPISLPGNLTNMAHILQDLLFSSLAPMPTLHISLIQSGGEIQMHDLLLGEHLVISCLFANAYWPLLPK